VRSAHESRIFKTGILTLVVLLGATAKLESQARFSNAIWRVGLLEGDRNQEFGIVTAVERDSAGRVYILDQRSNVLYAFDSLGRWIASAGRSGAGPGEFRVPTALALLGRDTVLVLDPANQRVSKFMLRHRSFHFVTSFRISPAAHAICAMNDRIYALGYLNGSIIHSYTSDGDPIKSFGEAFGGEHPIERATAATGHISCVPAAGLLIAASASHPEVRAYDTAGTLKWSLVPSKFRQFGITYNSNGSVTYSSAPGGYHMIASIAALSRTVGLVQIVHFEGAARHRDDFRSIESRLFSLETGREIRVQHNLLKVGWNGAGYAITVDNRDVPFAQIHRVMLP
jgi:hypothetical protein